MASRPAAELVFGGTLVKEVDTATQLMSEGLNQIVSVEWFAAEPAVAFTCLASGAERLLKLTFGMLELDQRDLFVSESRVKKLGHDLPQLNDLVLTQLRERASSSSAAYVLQLLDRLTADPYWTGVLRTIAAWADSVGRYRDLTILTGGRVPDDGPVALWQDVETRCIADLGLLADIAGPENRRYLAEMRTRLAQSVVLWWSILFRSWTHRLLGDGAVSPGTALNPASTRQLRPELVAIARSL